MCEKYMIHICIICFFCFINTEYTYLKMINVHTTVTSEKGYAFSWKPMYDN